MTCWAATATILNRLAGDAGASCGGLVTTPVFGKPLALTGMPAAAVTARGTWSFCIAWHLGSEPEYWLSGAPICRKSAAVETVKIRDLRGTDLRERTRDGKLLAITNRGALIGVLIPVTQAWIEHLIDYNWSHVRQSVDEGEQAMAAGTSMLTIDDVVAQADAHGYGEGQRHSTPERLAVPLVAAVVGGTVMQPPETRETLDRLRALLNPSGLAEGSAEPSVLTLRIGDLSAERIEQTGAAGRVIALTHDRELVGIVIPVTQGLVEFLIEQNMSRVLYNIGLGEKQLAASDKMITLDEALEQGAPPGPVSPARPASLADRTWETGITR
jgi:hypothetical protein